MHKALFSIIAKNLRTILRTRFFYFIVFFSLLCSFVLPFFVTHDNTLKGFYQLAISYALNLNTMVLSIAGLCFGIILTNDDKVKNHFHLLLSKPVNRLYVLIGQIISTSLVLATLLLCSSSLTLLSCAWRTSIKPLPVAEQKPLKSDLLLGRKEFFPEIKNSALKEKSIEFSKSQRFIFKNIPKGDSEWVYLRCRFSFYQKKGEKKIPLSGLWYCYNPKEKVRKKQHVPYLFQSRHGVFHELRLPASYISSDRTLSLTYKNIDPLKRSLIIEKDGIPRIMVQSTSFINNYFRAVLLILFQIIFMVILGTVLSILFTFFIALFSAISYLLLSQLTSLIYAMRQGIEEPANISIFMKFFDIISGVINKATFSLNEFGQVDALIEGRFIGLDLIFSVFAQILILRALPILLIGWLVFRHKELI